MSSPSKLFSDDHSLWIPNSSFQGAKSMVSFENDTKLTPTATVSFFKEEPQHDEEEEENENDDMELEASGGFGQKTTPTTSNKKRRLSTNQVSFLEKSFEVENKLEPERKVQLAKELGLLPRQVAIWFQNRRARFKTKQLERDYDALKASFDSLKADYDNLLKENDTLKTQVNSLKEKLAVKEKGKECLLEMENAIVMKAASEAVSNTPISVCKQEDASSAKSDVVDSSSDDSPHYAENNYTLFLEPADSSHVFEPEQSDFSQDDDDDLIMRKSFLAPSPFLPKIEACYYDDPPSSSCNLDFAVEDQPFNFWLY